MKKFLQTSAVALSCIALNASVATQPATTAVKSFDEITRGEKPRTAFAQLIKERNW